MEDFEEAIFWSYLQEGTRQSRTGLWIRGHLAMEGQNYIYQMWNDFRDFCTACLTWGKEQGYKKTVVRIPTPAYPSFYAYCWVLRKLGLIRKVEGLSEEAHTPWEKERVYVELAEKFQDHSAWKNPFKAYRDG